jgi:O-antigen/teichoic acid export membrane protein
VRRESLGVNAIAVTTARLLVPVLNLALVVSIARLDGISVLGRYTVLVTLFAILENLKSLGLTSLLVRDLAAKGTDSLAQYASLVRIGLWGAVLCVPAMTVVAWRGTRFDLSEAAVAAVLGLGLFPSAYALANDALFLALGRASLSTAIALGENLLRLIAALLVVHIFHGGMLWLIVAYVATRSLAALAGGLLLRRHLQLRPPAVCAKVTRAMIRQAPEFLSIFVAPILLFKMDVVLLALLRGDHAVGVYSAAMRLISVCLILPDGFMTASFASLSLLAHARDRHPFQDLINGTMNMLGSSLALLAACIAMFGGMVLRLLYGTRFDAAVPVLQLLGWALIPFAINRALGDALVARGKQRELACLVLISTIVSVIFYSVLITRFSYMGAAWAFNLSILFFASLSVWYACTKSGVAGLGAPLRTLTMCGAGLGCSFLPGSALKITLLVAIALTAALNLAISTAGLLRARRSKQYRIAPSYS